MISNSWYSVLFLQASLTVAKRKINYSQQSRFKQANQPWKIKSEIHLGKRKKWKCVARLLASWSAIRTFSRWVRNCNWRSWRWTSYCRLWPHLLNKANRCLSMWFCSMEVPWSEFVRFTVPSLAEGDTEWWSGVLGSLSVLGSLCTAARCSHGWETASLPGEEIWALMEKSRCLTVVLNIQVEISSINEKVIHN